MNCIDKEQLIVAYTEAYNRFDVDAMLNNLDEEITFNNISGGLNNLTLRGLNAFRKQALEATALFTERKQTPVAFIHNEEKTEVAIDYYAVLAIDLPNGLKKGEPLHLQGKSIFTFKGNKIIGITDIS